MKKLFNNRSAVLLAVLLILALICMITANSIQHSGGKVSIEDGSISSPYGDLTYKLYIPKTATEQSKAPGVLLLHGYQNDHETCAAYAIELSRRGAVVLCLDEYGHGSSSAGLINRGWVNHKVTVNYGNDSEEDGTFVSIGGPTRYKIMMNFSNLSFFNEKYVTDDDGNRLTDSSCGGIDSYAFLASLPYVDSTRLGISGHSMGTWAGWSVAAAYSDAKGEDGEDIMPKATVLQCGELFRDSAYDSGSIQFNNVLLLQAKYDEFSYFRDYKMTVSDDLLKTPLRYEFLGSDASSAAWNKTYGSFEDGSARRMELLMTNHRLTTHNEHGLTVAMQWFDETLDLPGRLDYSDHTANTKELLVMTAMLLCLAAMFPAMELLLKTPFFAYVKQELPLDYKVKSRKQIVRGGLITVLIAASTFPFMTQLGHGLLPLPENIFRMTVGNGFISWYGLLIIIMIVLTVISNRKSAAKGSLVTGWDMGLSSARSLKLIDWMLLGKGLLLGLCTVGILYVVNQIFVWIFDLDLRVIWPFFRPFTGARFLQFLVYFPFFAVFYILNNSKIMAGLRTKAVYKEGFGGFMQSWGTNLLIMAGGVLLVTLIEYIPFFAGAGPGMDLLFGFTFGGPFMSLLILFVPQVIFFSILCTYTYRRTGNVYTGAVMTAALSCWIVTGGSSIL